MQRDRWQQVSDIFEAALAVEPEARDALVAERCGADEALREEVELLIASHQKAGDEDFIGSPAAERAAPLLTDDAESERPPRLEHGQHVGDYIIQQLIGTGGMGEVYLATDTRLDRTVALKILPAEVASDQRRMLRFKQEARAVSTLNQPNILTIYEFGEVENLHFLASEYIDGETLRRRLVSGQLKLTEILDVVTQVCAALDAAHEARIVHRDIKPENIMIRRRDGVVKVLDFGLAKLADQNLLAGSATDTEADTAVLVKTVPGSIMGTFNYMSPEQAQGKRVDQRSDIWSIGVVLYEMVAGRTPFTGPTHSHTVVSILEKEPETLTHSAKTRVPPELERIVGKALAKNPDERYQTVKDLLIDVRNLRKQQDLETDLRRSETDGAKSSPAVERDTVSQHPISTQETATSSSRTLLVVALAVLVFGIAIATYLWRSPSATSSPPAVEPMVTRQLNYWIEVQKYRDGNPFEAPFTMAKEINFEKDYRVRLNVKTPTAGYLYVLNDGPEEGEPLSVLFPSPTTNGGSAFLTENKVTSIPETSWFRFDSQRGAEKVWLVWSPDTIPALEAVRRFANTNDKGVINDADLNREALSFIQRNAEPKPAVEKNLEGKETLVKSNRNIVVHLITLEHH